MSLMQVHIFLQARIVPSIGFILLWWRARFIRCLVFFPNYWLLERKPTFTRRSPKLLQFNKRQRISLLSLPFILTWLLFLTYKRLLMWGTRIFKSTFEVLEYHLLPRGVLDGVREWLMLDLSSWFGRKPSPRLADPRQFLEGKDRTLASWRPIRLFISFAFH